MVLTIADVRNTGLADLAVDGVDEELLIGRAGAGFLDDFGAGRRDDGERAADQLPFMVYQLRGKA